MRRRLVIALGSALAATVCAAAAELGYPGSALKEFERGARPSFEEAPPLEAEPAPGRHVPSQPEPAPRAPSQAAPEPERPSTTFDEYVSNCFVKIEGRVLFSGRCQILREKEKSVTFELADNPLVLAIERGRTWTARLGDRDLGKVYKRGSCWGAKGFYACDRGR